MAPMPESRRVAEILLSPLGLKVTSCTELQTLWAGYGHVCAITAKATDEKAAAAVRDLCREPGKTGTFRLVLKLISPPPGPKDEGHVRKILSYDVEQYFYDEVVPRLPHDVAVASCLASSRRAKDEKGELQGLTATILTDLRDKFPVAGEKRSVLNAQQVYSSLEWLANFHGSSRESLPASLDDFLLPPLEESSRRQDSQTAGSKLWLNGGYTYLATRRKEYASLAGDTYSEWSDAFCSPFDGSPLSTAETVAKFLTPCGRQFETYIHGDVKSENLFTTESGEAVCFFDFQYAGLGLGVCDLAKLFTCSVPLDMLTDNNSLPDELPMDKGEESLLELYHEAILGRQCKGKNPLVYDWETFVRHWETALVDWCRFQASWGFWGNTEWLEARARNVGAEGWESQAAFLAGKSFTGTLKNADLDPEPFSAFPLVPIASLNTQILHPDGIPSFRGYAPCPKLHPCPVPEPECVAQRDPRPVTPARRERADVPVILPLALAARQNEAPSKDPTPSKPCSLGEILLLSNGSRSRGAFANQRDRREMGYSVCWAQRVRSHINDQTGGTYRLTFFSDSRLESLSTKLRNNKVNDLVRRISMLIKSRLRSPDATSAVLTVPTDSCFDPLDKTVARKYISTYYERVHPLFPHLDRESFESTVSSSNLQTILTEEPSFSALYHVVLALGCLYDGGGSFEPGKGKAWELFSVALALLPSLEKSTNPLVALQAITTAAVYSLGVSCVSIEQRVMTQAARMAQDLGPMVSNGPSAKAFSRIFWVLYPLEKMASFHFGRSSALVDADVVIPMPHIPESLFGSFNWSLTFARHSRLLSRAITTLFSPGICPSELDYYTTTITQLEDDLEQWRLSIPEGLRPGPSCQPHLFRQPITGTCAIWINYLYYSFKLILLRFHLQITGEGDQGEPSVSRENLIAVSRSILEIITYVDVEPSTPLWILAGIPICALFVLFDQVVNDPKHADTRSNLALLDIAGGHFSRMEFASGGSLPGSLIAEFAYIAREYVNETTSPSFEMKGSHGSYPSNSEGMMMMAAPETMGFPGRSGCDVGNDAGALELSTPLVTGQDTTSWSSSSYLPWISGNDLLLGIDVMDIFNSLA
ncbi:hypothetical protein FZEAL_6915 [Fusarium zealandicum]|uniref:Xylanolytic transcriptional activator regulatory domain-containing protein n=1 Tax=Fusarium zealandicum TaxID=1053134 RepID=A0A8H4XIC8_9HYPO|nr:hypothetical protein FZEAL_6915 [Fusarium zealandicum]